MAWVCPTFQRPDRLRVLADSWERCQPGKGLFVRIVADDPRREEYWAQQWPEGWVLYESDDQLLGDALNAFWAERQEDPFCGFIADDVVLHTPGGLEILEREAADWFIAYPNDTVHRHQLPTHFCIGKELLKRMGFFTHPFFKHDFMDCVWHAIGAQTGLLRYCPQVIFEHQHWINGKAEEDATYKAVDPIRRTALAGWEHFVRKELPRAEEWVQEALYEEFEKPIFGEVQDGTVLCDSAE